MNSLAQQIDKLNHTLSSQLPIEVLQAFRKSIEELKTSNLEKNSLKIGDKMPEFSLPNTVGQMISSREILKKEKMILTFYRGNWCPYCNLELRSLQENLSLIKNKNSFLAAVSPQTLHYSKTTVEENDLGFDVLTDAGNAFAKKLGIVFQLTDFLLPYYESLGIDLTEFNGNEDNMLPIPAVFVVDRNGYIIFRFLDVNYMNRLDIEELIKVL
ncbi:AhpC/TSA family protein [Chryseobacterium carnipullorum]|uniref:thioredoxin-dependent peroxiredoxin n=1 Tax=Chryseobacterium carnipullorum TaxID=1124835 RepID=A0A376DNK4_CHRCU|nr:peroxiredoxin-like family protein [Chryseobacterium carnipullorum]AZA48578.1 AhpC/TSA family protein [Chryseobacterium carnipullorum]AZA63500.1 AhpC/TSA family protein [Chryseobacterium carnipullorum]STC92694.1 Putative peroxiredoxin bcp [Chryseobacterium carnipullorum]